MADRHAGDRFEMPGAYVRWRASKPKHFLLQCEWAQSLLTVMRRGSLRAAEEITGHKYETISVWRVSDGSSCRSANAGVGQ